MPIPNQAQAAVTWELKQTSTDDLGVVRPVTAQDPRAVVDKVREYFNTNAAVYTVFSFEDLMPFLPK